MSNSSESTLGSSTISGDDPKHNLDKDYFSSQQVPWRDDDYEQRFPEDPIFDEAGPNARVWRIYLAESAAFDQNMIGEARDGLDAILIFAGLFSSVVASFLVQSSQNLQPNYPQQSVTLLQEIIAIQRATLEDSPLPPLQQLDSGVDSNGAWVNGLWNLSLALSLLVAFASLLVKQWLHHYMTLPSGSSQERSHLRHYRFVGFKKWKVLPIIASLPLIMHLSLILFFVGLVVSLHPLRASISFIVGIVTLVFYLLCLGTNILPVFFPSSPYQTPLSRIFFKIKGLLRPGQLNPVASQSQPSYLRGLEGSKLHAIYDSLTPQALHWLYTMSSNPSVRSVVIQAIGGLSASSKSDVEHLFSDCISDMVHLLLKCTSSIPNSHTRQAKIGFETVTERICRAISFFNLSSPDNNLSSSKLMGYISSVTFPMSTNPHFEASSFSIENQKSLRSAQEYRTFISTYHVLPHHPVVWNQILLKAIDHGAFAKFVCGDEQDALLCSVVLKSIWPSPPSRSHPDRDTLTMTMADAIHFYWPQEHRGLLRDIFLEMLSPFNHSFVEENQVLVAALEFALYHITRNPSRFESSHWNIIDHVFTHYGSDSPNTLFDFRADAFHTYLGDFVVRLIQTSDILWDTSPKSGHESILRRRTTILNVYGKTRRTQEPGTPDFPQLRRAIQGTLQRVHYLVDHPDEVISESAALSFLSAMDILSLGLRSGSIEAYQITVDHHCLELLHKFAARQKKLNKHGIAFLESYLAGLKKITSNAKETGIDYLYCNSTNLCLIIILLIFRRLYAHASASGSGPAAPGSVKSKTTAFWLTKLTELRPDVEIWKDCLMWLTRVKAWAIEEEEEREESACKRHSQAFVDRHLGEEWLGAILQLPLLISGLQVFRSPLFIRELQRIIQWLEKFVESSGT
ncbi:hypothetical protein GYMLUDRAFT_54199 [Collybiopsis luxurians FD-317 M1]|nr:hypothetical protein GYMLUDRAFT_54199 [Collybiopsis luxurians FD-317 M1]